MTPKKVGSPAPVYLAARRIETACGPVLTGHIIDVSHWSPAAIRVSLSAGEIMLAGAPGRSQYVAVQRLRVGDGWIEAGQEIPDATWRSSRGATCYIAAGQIKANPLLNTRMPNPIGPPSGG